MQVGSGEAGEGYGAIEIAAAIALMHGLEDECEGREFGLIGRGVIVVKLVVFRGACGQGFYS